LTENATETAVHDLWSDALSDAVTEVLEKMFFIEATAAPSQVSAQPQSIVVELEFDGDPPGVFRMSLAREAASQIAADFLGEDVSSLSVPQVEDVVKELANMICGAVLSRVESSATFRLAAPNILPVEHAVVNDSTVCVVETGNGLLTAEIHRREREWSPIARSAS
jgi:CheY-specific phosphatase CheX